MLDNEQLRQDYLVVYGAATEYNHTIKNGGNPMACPALYQTFAQYNQIMNQRLYGICSGMSDEARKQDRGAFFKSIHGTLDHILHGDRAWINRLANKNYVLKDLGTNLFDNFDELAVERVKLDSEICQWSNELTSDWLASEMTWASVLDKFERTQPRWLLASHMFNHQTHHRGQLSTLLNQAGYDVGITDLPRLV